jgi:hypothetical protein
VGRRRRLDDIVDDDSRHDDARRDHPACEAQPADPAHRHSLAYSERKMTLALTTQMLGWLDEQPRSYAETLDAWKTSCPRLSIWEDAIADRLIRIGPEGVRLTHAGREFLEAASLTA